jgi:hypothetical protein
MDRHAGVVGFGCLAAVVAVDEAADPGVGFHAGIIRLSGDLIPVWRATIGQDTDSCAPLILGRRTETDRRGLSFSWTDAKIAGSPPSRRPIHGQSFR